MFLAYSPAAYMRMATWKKILSCSASPPITRKFRKIDQKKTHWAREGCQKSSFRSRSAGIFSHFSWYFWHFSCFSVVLALVSLVFWHVQVIVYTIWTYKCLLCLTGVYIATKKVFALMFSVWCVRVEHSSSAQCTKNAYPLVLSIFLHFFLENHRPHTEPRVGEKHKKSPP